MPTNVIEWDAQGQHFYETGVDHGVLYVFDPTNSKYNTGVAWNGLTSVSESPEGAEVTALYADNIKYLNLMSAEDYKGTIEAYTYPDEFNACNGVVALTTGMKIGQQKREKFGVCYRTRVGNDNDNEAGYKLHIVYNCLASPSERSYETVNDSPEAMTLSFEFSTTPVNVPTAKPTATVTIDSIDFNTDVLKTKLALLEACLFGTDTQADITAISAVITGFDGKPTLPTPAEIYQILTGNALQAS